VFLLRLAMQFGLVPSALESQLTVGEWTEYKALYNLSPWGNQREDYKAALHTAALVAVMTDGNVDIPRYHYQQIHDRGRRNALETHAEKQARHRAGFEALNAALAAKAARAAATAAAT